MDVVGVLDIIIKNLALQIKELHIFAVCIRLELWPISIIGIKFILNII
jgi:hypothetical protein